MATFDEVLEEFASLDVGCCCAQVVEDLSSTLRGIEDFQQEACRRLEAMAKPRTPRRSLSLSSAVRPKEPSVSVGSGIVRDTRISTPGEGKDGPAGGYSPEGSSGSAQEQPDPVAQSLLEEVLQELGSLHQHAYHQANQVLLGQHPSLVELRSNSSRCSNSSRSRAGSGSLILGQPGSTSSELGTVELSSRCSTEDSDSNAFLTPPTSPSSPTTQPPLNPHISRRLGDQTPTHSDDEIMTAFSKERRVLRRWVSEEPTALFRTSSVPISMPERPPRVLPTFSMEDLTRHLAEIYLVMGEPVDPRVWENMSQDSQSGCGTPNSNDETILRAPVPYGPPPPKPPRLKDRVSCIIQSNNTAFKNTEGISKSLSHLPNNSNSQTTCDPGIATNPALGGTLPLFPSERQRGVEPYQSPYGSPKAESLFTKLKKHRPTLRRKSSKLGRNLTIGHPSKFQHLGTGIESLKNLEKDDGGDSLDSLSHEDEDSIPEENSLELSRGEETSSDEEKNNKKIENLNILKKKVSLIDTDDCKSLKIQNEICNEKIKVDSNENLSDDAKHEKAKNR